MASICGYPKAFGKSDEADVRLFRFPLRWPLRLAAAFFSTFSSSTTIVIWGFGIKKSLPGLRGGLIG